VNIDGGIPPLYIVPTDQPIVRGKFVDRDNPDPILEPLQAQWNAVPLPDNFQPAGQGEGDQEAVVYQPSTGKMWEFWLMKKTCARVQNSAGQMVDEWEQDGADAWMILPRIQANG
jgi:hypothetical protein